jgi:hypothetical protein
MRTPWRRHDASILALTIVAFGVLALVGGVIFADVRAILYVLFWTFLFAVVLFRFLTPERRVRATVAEKVYAAPAANTAALVEADDQANAHVYVPKRAERPDDVPARLVVSPHYSLDSESIDATSPEPSFEFLDTDRPREVSLQPSGGRLFREFESMLRGDLSESPDELAVQLADGVTEGLELADRVVLSAGPTERQVAFEVADSPYGPVDRFDHPVQSFLAVGLAAGLARPVVAETTAKEGDSGYAVRCRWETSERSNGAKSRRSTRTTST